MSGLKGVFGVNRETWLVQPGDSYKISVSILRRDPPPKHHPACTRHHEQIAIPRRLRSVGGQRAMGAMIMDKFLKGSEKWEHSAALARGRCSSPSP